ncbi:MAG: class I SAM-dependent methyltransferase [Deltaproteobacteria bacterium]|nr:class I SAM-dependent methyltransferase [Deltaproteobacteria bacterium]
MSITQPRSRRLAVALATALTLPLAAACASSSSQEVAVVTPGAAAPEAPPPTVTPAEDPLAAARAAQAAVAAPDRSEADRALDAGRHPAETFTFFGIRPGMRVAELGAGGGYTSELLARIVGPKGVVYGNNSPFILERFAQKPWTERLAKPVNARVVRLDTPFDAPFPEGFPDAGELDAVVNILFYHDTVWQGVDRAAMNAAIFAALKPGGIYGIVDHAARPEDGVAVTQTLHRIAEKAVIDEITAAGFVLDAEADFLRNPDDPHDWNAAPGASGDRRGTSDRFVLRFRKP